jgi:hypothetical protein
MVKKLSSQFHRRPAPDDSDQTGKIWRSGLTAEEREEAQRKAFENNFANDESQDFYARNEDGTSNESPSNNGEPAVSTNAADPQQDVDQYWLEYKQNWISHNQPVLDQEYMNWVKSHVDYNLA